MNNRVRKRLPSRRTVMSVLYHALFLLAMYIIQALILPFIRPLYAVPLLLPLAAIGAAMFGGGQRGAAMGLIAGALCDLSFLRPVAAFALLLTVICLVVGVLADTVIARGLLSYLVVCVAALVICSLAQMFSPFFFEGVRPRVLFIAAAQQTAVSFPFCFALYPIARAVYKPEENKK